MLVRRACLKKEKEKTPFNRVNMCQYSMYINKKIDMVINKWWQLAKDNEQSLQIA